MKFKKYVKEDFVNPDAQDTYIKDEIDTFYAPVKKLIDEGKYDEARAELDALEKDLNEFERENAKKKIFKFPKFMIDGQRKQLASLRAKLPTNESLSDMDRRCEKCNTLLNDGGTCPKCDDGEEDYGDERGRDDKDDKDLDEELKGSHENITYLANAFKKALDKTDFEFKIKMKDGYKINITSTMFNKIKDFANKFFKKFNLVVDIEEDNGSYNLMLKPLKTQAQESLNEETLDNKQKLINAFPDVDWNFENSATHPVTESSTEELTAQEKLIQAYPDVDWNFEDKTVTEAVKNSSKIMNTFSDVDWSFKDKTVTAEVDSKDRGPEDKLNPDVDKDKSYPEYDPKSETDEIKRKIISAFPDVDWEFKDDIVTEEVDPEDSWYDDDYDDFDDVEEDRRHAALYGGDRTYCNCGKKLIRTDWGSYCPECDPETAEEEHDRVVYDDEDFNEGFLSSMFGGKLNEEFADESTCEWHAKECSYDIAHNIAIKACKELGLSKYECEDLEHDINNLRSNEWVDSFQDLPDSSPVKKLFFKYAVECIED